MAIQLSTFRSFPTAFTIVAASALAFTGPPPSPSRFHHAQLTPSRPATIAAPVSPTRRATAADGAEAGKQANAKRFVSTGKKLCEAGNERRRRQAVPAPRSRLPASPQLETDSKMASAN